MRENEIPCCRGMTKPNNNMQEEIILKLLSGLGADDRILYNQSTNKPTDRPTN
jgi:hypothetical protein